MKKPRLAVIGDPVSHSLSPLFQNAALKKLGLNWEYRALRVRAVELRAFMAGPAKQLAGFNVTIPHKESILPMMDRLSFEAQVIGAVNTVVIRNGERIGFNTDGSGYLLSLQQEKKLNPKSRHVTLLGAGGAARAIASVLCLNRVKSLTLANRSIGRGEALAGQLRGRFPKIEIFSCELWSGEFEAALRRSQLLVNTTSVGLHGSAFENFPYAKLKKGALVSDIVYNPRLTPFLKAAKKAGHPIHSGEGMLAQQGALSLELWTGKVPDVKLMMRVLRKELG
jgi:shikimate 5-dehydrogenase